ncbi:hypothetical protein [Acetobacterium wieringae]|uniref:hypothetical protein n=1 Tax=Acetobacterium wieringae TaxID=52694 RepID=UPI002033445D|nr:hypothetical protein [Acetobacterium wieringae]URN84007.1 hypothetical protein CHL1_003175 [Acetobacterium wieringae]
MKVTFYSSRPEENNKIPIRVEDDVCKITIRPQAPNEVVTRKNDNGVEVVRGDLVTIETSSGVDEFINENNDCYIEIVDESQKTRRQ